MLFMQWCTWLEVNKISPEPNFITMRILIHSTIQGDIQNVVDILDY